MKMSRKIIVVLSALWLISVLVAMQPGILYGTPQIPRPSPDYPLLAMLVAGAFLALFSGYIGVTELRREQVPEA